MLEWRQRARATSHATGGARRAPCGRLGAVLLGVALVGWLGCGDPPSESQAKKEPSVTAFSATAALPAPPPGRTVVVRVLDRNAAPVPGAKVYALLAEETPVAAVPIGNGDHRLEGLEAERVPIRVEVAGQVHGIDHPSSRPRATLVLPVGGSLEVVWRVPQLAALPAGTVWLLLQARQDPEVRFELEVERSEDVEGKLRVPYMAPGEYLASLELWRVSADEAEDPAKVLPLTAPRQLWIEEAQATRVVLGTPARGPR